jgi:hypothetical protein
VISSHPTAGEKGSREDAVSGTIRKSLASAGLALAALAIPSVAATPAQAATPLAHHPALSSSAGLHCNTSQNGRSVSFNCSMDYAYAGQPDIYVMCQASYFPRLDYEEHYVFPHRDWLDGNFSHTLTCAPAFSPGYTGWQWFLS